MQAHFAEERFDADVVGAHVRGIEAGHVRRRGKRAPDLKRRFERTRHRNLHARELIDETRQIVCRRVHLQIERIERAQSQRTAGRRGEAGRYEFGTIDDDACAVRMHAGRRRLERQRAEGAVFDRGIAAQRELRIAPANRCAPRGLSRNRHRRKSERRNPQREVEIADRRVQIVARTRERLVETRFRREADGSAGAKPALRPADCKRAVDDVARARPRRIGVANRKIAVAERPHRNVPAGRKAVAAHGGRDFHWTAAVKRIARVEVVVEIGEIRVRCVDVDRAVARMRRRVEGDARRGHLHVSVARADAARIGGQRRAAVDKSQTVDRSGRDADVPGNRRRGGRSRDGEFGVKRSFGCVVGQVKRSQCAGDIGSGNVGGERVTRAVRRERSEAAADSRIGRAQFAEHPVQVRGLACQPHLAVSRQRELLHASVRDRHAAAERRKGRARRQIAAGPEASRIRAESEPAQLVGTQTVGDQRERAARTAGGEIERARGDDVAAGRARVRRIDAQTISFDAERDARVRDRNAAQRRVVHRKVRRLNDDARRQHRNGRGAGQRTVRGNRVAEKRLQSLEGATIASARNERLGREGAAAGERAPRTRCLQPSDVRAGERSAERRIDAIEMHSSNRRIARGHACPRARRRCRIRRRPRPRLRCGRRSAESPAASSRGTAWRRNACADCSQPPRTRLWRAGDRACIRRRNRPVRYAAKTARSRHAVGIECEERGRHGPRRAPTQPHLARGTSCRRRSPRHRPASARVRAFRRGRAADRRSRRRAPPTASAAGARCRAFRGFRRRCLGRTRAAAASATTLSRYNTPARNPSKGRCAVDRALRRSLRDDQRIIDRSFDQDAEVR